eukprot:CAMPEP_0206617276 /NCGR_PEP_ID=MMETSP0325_2-20121206/59504_1 /ASSEMBLY_ACC=CAM_ASM_000347 /TAXON_ID=2866 /ORGANISM="Crypthecodinium cohnii, Strain Seligo" /LENGTH=58 /DNA_ID=CAMNT_0054139159 /DNA_START=93 /DNA_END=265 /DNA_ORIENTATION=-
MMGRAARSSLSWEKSQASPFEHLPAKKFLQGTRDFRVLSDSIQLPRTLAASALQDLAA